MRQNAKCQRVKVLLKRRDTNEATPYLLLGRDVRLYSFFNSLMSFSVCFLKPARIIYMYYILKIALWDCRSCSFDCFFSNSFHALPNKAGKEDLKSRQRIRRKIARLSLLLFFSIFEKH